jgi:hypothetical protein
MVVLVDLLGLCGLVHQQHQACQGHHLALLHLVDLLALYLQVNQAYLLVQAHP